MSVSVKANRIASQNRPQAGGETHKVVGAVQAHEQQGDQAGLRRGEAEVHG
ncbi:hypothetical protein M2437_001447 [Methylorubrum pseudosasae]|nr:hypothetical protein [Methylorubrum pseudosasae]